jgi:hypothetical protein
MLKYNVDATRQVIMRIIKTGILASLCEQVPGCRDWVTSLLADLRGLPSSSISIIMDRYPNAIEEPGQFLVFNFSADGVQCRMRVQVAEGAGVLCVKWAGTATQYESYLAEVNYGN